MLQGKGGNNFPMHINEFRLKSLGIVELLGIVVGRKLNLNEYFDLICKRVSYKLFALHLLQSF